MTDLQKGREYTWERPPWPTSRRRDQPPRVNISARIKDMTRRDRWAVYQILQDEEPEIALLVKHFNETFGALELHLDPQTAQRVLAVVDGVTSDRLDGRGR